MTENPLLNYQLQLPQSTSQGDNHTLPTLIFLHGMFGDLNNLGILARAYADHFPLLRIDLRNHGHSFHHSEMNYELMAHDVIRLIHHLKLERLILIGHSMGGKTAMQIAALLPNQVEKLVVLDIAPVTYHENHHDDVFKALFAVKQAHPQSRQQADPILQRHIQQLGVRQFMLKSFAPQQPDCFLFNLTALYNNYPNLLNWQAVYSDVPALLIKGGRSNYILPEYKDAILAQFPNATAFTISRSGHWIHSDSPELVIKAIDRFLALIR
ncbi:alpha/beta fold hydrolase [Testudinibacter sp. TR-2022]|uniref:alpha/beta fold hydrolase n=1 Tax=Testudinibacter sp. TR-2022 TaxID=2585029 RepID=UPI00111ADD81|nr:alpha/beta fold hydrolase [Testudinibacter sp. TR-2022]TNH05820.1 alpha/beta fold hydrolase [Pasteurellaceae bacterium Phil31]TNH07341.1 alpha/beta fold hydrolase [Testudinibacter sp. TR-2022]TNH10698.1 alpha/beta fold hydrolase [Testudinibacter sp. TR-2022]TNH14302.1 alpha/beta fold hydrolase [Testudinibacter sp. TR-2022]TNH16376.1 alpha/beta fold hydrolase [Testudinibacter sp. TR-2022]